VLTSTDAVNNLSSRTARCQTRFADYYHIQSPEGTPRVAISTDRCGDPVSALAVNTPLRIRDEPNQYEHLCVLSFIMTIDRPGTEPLILEAKSPATLIAKLSQYPPRGDLHTLQKPVDFATQDNPATVVTILQFPLKMGGL
jgi:hypothetical protein